MPVLGITGSIGTGKSTFVRALHGCLPAEIFDSDRCARELLEQDPAVRAAVLETFGASVLDSAGAFDRARLRDLVFAQELHRRQLESILHPAIRSRWQSLAGAHRSTESWMFVDIPLLFETGAESFFDRTITVACSPAIQRQRLKDHRGLDDHIIEQIIGAQLDLDTKMRRADHVIWNDSTPGCLTAQAALLAHWLTNYYG